MTNGFANEPSPSSYFTGRVLARIGISVSITHLSPKFQFRYDDVFFAAASVSPVAEPA